MAFLGSPIQQLSANKMSQPYYRFDGVDDYIQTTALVAQTKALSISVNFMLETLQSGFATIIQVGDLLITKKETTHIVHVNKSGVAGVDGTTALVADKWYHMVVTVDGSNTKIYLDGVLSDTLAATAFQTGVTYFGKYSGGQFTNCQISDTRVYDIVLSAAEVADIYGGSNVPFKYAQPGNVLTGDPNLATGWSSNGMGGPTTGQSDPVGGSSAILRPVASSQTDAYLEASNQITHKIGETFRFSVWMKVASGTDDISIHLRGTNNEKSTTNCTVTTSWQQFSVTRTFGDAGSNGEAIIGGYSTWVTGEDIYFYNAIVERPGCIAEYDGGSAIDTTWYDKSGNNLDGTVSGATIQNRIDALEVVGVLKTGDIELENERGHWKIIEESEYLSITNVNTNKKYKLLMEEIE